MKQSYNPRTPFLGLLNRIVYIMATLQDIIDIIDLESKSIDSLFRNKPRYMMGIYAREGMKALNLTVGTHILGMNFTVPGSCRVYKPEGYESFIRAYILNSDGNTIEIAVNKNVPEEVKRFLVNCDGTLLSGCDGGNITDNCLDTQPRNNYDPCECADPCDVPEYECLSETQQMLLDIEYYKDEWIAERKDYFEFSEGLEGVAMVIEYVSNNTVGSASGGNLSGVEDCAVDVDESLALALEYYIRYRLLETGQDTIQQAQYYRRQYKQLRDKEKNTGNALTKKDLLNILAG